MIKFNKLRIIALDTNIFICALNEKDPRQKETRQLLEQIKKENLSAYISVLVLEEFFIRIFKQAGNEALASNLDFVTLNGLINVLDMNKEVALLAAKLRAEYVSLRTPDAIHLASAIFAKADVFITTDKKIPREVEKLKVLVLK